MSPGAASSLREHFDRLVDLRPEQRDAALAALAAEDPLLAEQLGKLLPAGLAADGANDPLAERVLRGLEAAPLVQGSLGPYRLLRLLGAGGMGWVYLAEREIDGVRQQVALKLVRGTAEATAGMLFRRERAVLASLQHPNIARFLDAGTVAGQPYLAMEYVDGRPLGEWLAQRQPRLRERIAFMVALARAVDHAHANLVVHRDLKPANLLVRGDDSPVLLDFGIAKLLDGDDDPRRTATRVYTPTYAAPEQLAGRPVTVATDVHALGLLLFEVLCGEPARREHDQVPRTRAGEVARASDVAWVRRDAEAINIELDRIVAMALREEPERRYRSAAELAADLERWQQGLQVQAMPDTLGYRSRTWLRRHRWGAAVAAAAILASLLFVVQLQSALQRALAAEQAAEQKARTAQAVADLMTDLFSGADPRVARNAEVSARALLERGAERLASHGSGDRAIDVQLRLTVGQLLAGIGDPAAAVVQFDAGLALQPADPLQRADLLHERARALSRKDRHAEAEASARQALALRETVLGADAPAVGHVLQSLGVAVEQQERADEAEALFLRAEALFAAQQPPDREALASSRHNMGWIAQRRGDMALASRRFRQAVDDKTALYGWDDPRTIFSMVTLAQALADGGDRTQAIAWLRRAVEGRRKSNGDSSLDTAFALNELAMLLQDEGELVEAQAHFEEGIAVARRVASESIDLARLLNNLATLQELRGDLSAAEQHFRESLGMRLRLFGAEHVNTLRVEHNLCRVLMEQARFDEARRCAGAVFERRRALLGDGHPESEDSRAIVEALRDPPDRAWLVDRFQHYRQQGEMQLARSMRLGGLLVVADGDHEDIERLLALAQALRESQGERSLRAALVELQLARLAHALGQTAVTRGALSRSESVLDASLASAAPSRTLLQELQARAE